MTTAPTQNPDPQTPAPQTPTPQSTAVSQQMAKKAATRTSVVGAMTNLSLVAIKGFGGMATGSQALIADAIHSAGDLVTDLIAFVAVQLGRNDADDSHPYGHGKFETFGTLVLSVVLAGVGIGVFWNLIQQLISGETHQLGPMALVAAGASVVLNEALFRYTLIEGKKVNSKTIIANAWHHRADGLSSIAVFAGIGLNMFGFTYGDHVAAAIVGAILLKIAYSLGREAFDELVEAAVPEGQQHLIKEAIDKTEGVLDCHMMRARFLGGDILIDAHIDVDPLISVSEGHRIAELVEYNITKVCPEAVDVTIHVDPLEHSHEPPKAAKQPSRPALEQLIYEVVSRTAPKAKIMGVTFHFIDDVRRADIVFSGITHGELLMAKPNIVKALTTEAINAEGDKEKPPFTAVSLSLLV